MEGDLFFDLWYQERWTGMSMGKTVEEARDMVTKAWPRTPPEQVLMTPFYGCGTSYQTYKAITGKDARGAPTESVKSHEVDKNCPNKDFPLCWCCNCPEKTSS